MITLGTSSAFRPYFRPSSLSQLLVSPPVTSLTPSPLLVQNVTPIVNNHIRLPSVTSSTEYQSGSTGKTKRKRTTFTSSQAAILEKEYELDQYMPRSRRLTVAQSLSLSENQIKTWFQNRRAKDKKTKGLNGCPLTAGLPYTVPNIEPTSPILNNDPQSPCPSSSGDSVTPPLTFATPLPSTIPPPLSENIAPPIAQSSLLQLLALGKDDILGLLSEEHQFLLHSFLQNQ